MFYLNFHVPIKVGGEMSGLWVGAFSPTRFAVEDTIYTTTFFLAQPPYSYVLHAFVPLEDIWWFLKMEAFWAAPPVSR